MTNVYPTPLPPCLFDIIAWVETKNNPHAMRFEPAMYAHASSNAGAIDGGALGNAIARNKCSQGTGHMIYSTSFGAVQIMGFNLYGGLGYAGDVVQFMGDPIAQAAAFDAFCNARQIHFTVDVLAGSPQARALFAKVYNGDADAYAPLIVDALKHFGIGVTE